MAPTNKHKKQEVEAAPSPLSSNKRIKHKTEPSTSTTTRKTKRKFKESNFTESEEASENRNQQPHKRARRVSWKPELVEVRTFQQEASVDSSSKSEIDDEADDIDQGLAEEPLEDVNSPDAPEDNPPDVQEEQSEDTPARNPHPAVSAMWEVVHEGERWKMDFIWEIHQVDGKPRDLLARSKWRKLRKEKPGIYNMIKKEDKYLQILEKEKREKKYSNQKKIEKLEKQRLKARQEYTAACRTNGYERWIEKGAPEREIEMPETPETPEEEAEEVSDINSQPEEEIPPELPEADTPDQEEEDDSTSSSKSEEEIVLRYPEIPDGYPNDELEAWRTRVRREIEDRQLGKDDSDAYWRSQVRLMYEENFELFTLKMNHDAYLEEYKEYHIALHFPGFFETVNEIRRRRRHRRNQERELTTKGKENKPQDFCTMWEEKMVEEAAAQGLGEKYEKMWRRIRENDLRERKPALWRLLKRDVEEDYWLEKTREEAEWWHNLLEGEIEAACDN